MVLKYNFEYSSNNSTLIKFINSFFQNENFEYRINQKNEEIEVFVEGEEEKLIQVSEKLGTSLPMSIYFKNYTLEVVPQLLADCSNSVLQTYDVQLPYCLNCLADTENIESTNYYNPFLSCAICGTTCDVENFKYDNKTYDDNKKLFENLASDISLGQKIKIKTLSGDFVFYKKEKIEASDELLCVDINELHSFVTASKEETVALVSLEKPRIKLKVNEQYKIIKAITTNEVFVRYPNDLVLYLLGLELAELGVKFLVYEQDIDYDKEVTYKKDTELLDIPTIALVEGKTLILKSNSYDEKLDEVYSKIEQKQKAQFTVLLKENNLYEKSILNIFVSKTEADNITLYSQKIDGMIDIINYHIPSSMNEVFEDISSSDSGKRLVENYKNKYPELYEKAIAFDTSKIKNESIFAFWELAQTVLGIDNIYESANKSLLDKGPRVDYKVLESDKIFNKQFEFSKFIQSGISFKLAGVDNNTLSLGYLESFAYYLANVIDDISNEFELDGISLCGDMISSPKFNKLVKKAITKNFKLYYNKDFPIQN